MQQPLDPLRFKQNHYDRPNQDWICGHAASGLACPLGPDARGNCRHTGECLPAKKGDRWLCMRTEASGGKCEEGPLPDGTCAHPIPPCQPVRSVRRSRALFVWLAVALTTGGLLILLGNGTLRQPWMDPGPLTNSHATSASKCSDCHAVDREGQPTLAVFTSLDQERLADSRLCLKCHALGPQPLDPHGMAAAGLIAREKRMTQSPNEKKSAPVFLRVSHAINPIRADAAVLACATCHQEHHGRQFDLKKLSNAQCQSCHAIQFASFENGHPDFGSYPYRARTRIFFDHASHLQQHFAERKEKAPISCSDCHTPGPSGRFMLVRNFAQTCAACHESQIRGEGMTVKGVAFFTVPGIDSETLAERGIGIGEWPKFADGKVTPFMEVLLDRQPETRAALQKLQGVDLLDLTKAKPEQLAAAAQLAWGVKTLLFNLVVKGPAYLQTELQGRIEPTGLEVSRAALLAAQKEWMPHLLQEVSNYKKGIKPPLSERAQPKAIPTPSPNEKVPSGDESLLEGDDLVAATPTPPSPGEEDLLAAGSQDHPAPTPAASDDLTTGD
ncbi:MAG TPA: cytochrome c3 family protein, partial [Chthoniobacterales bacterium]